MEPVIPILQVDSIQQVIDGITNLGDDRQNMWAALKLPITFGILLLVGVELSYRGSGILLTYALPKFEAAIRMA